MFCGFFYLAYSNPAKNLQTYNSNNFALAQGGSFLPKATVTYLPFPSLPILLSDHAPPKGVLFGQISRFGLSKCHKHLKLIKPDLSKMSGI
jgi:hypothetical protein